MEHLVRFTTAEGREGQHAAPSLDDALKFVERLRNNEEASEVRVFRMQEVPISFRAYYRVELTADAATGDEPAPVGDALESVPPVPAGVHPPLAATPIGHPDNGATDGSGRRLFSRS